jgi:hypothetical protein
MDDKPEPFLVMEQCTTTYMHFVTKVHDSFLLPKQPQTRTVLIGPEPIVASSSVLFGHWT